jgi:hypothetical protein
MAHPDTLASEIEKLEKETYGEPSKEEPTKEASEAAEEPVEQPVEETVETPVEETLESEEPTDVAKEETQPAVSQPEDWEKRFKNFKATTDVTIHGLRQENMYYREEMQKQQDQIQDLAKKFAEQQSTVDPFKDLSEEERELIGEETLEILRKSQATIIQKEVAPIKEELAKERDLRNKQNERQLERDKQEVYQRFLTKLADLVPHYGAIDTNPQFIKWMEQPDPVSGYPRANIFKNAQAAGDVQRVADFFLEYEKLTTPKDKLADKVNPTKTGGPPQTRKPKENKKPVITQKFAMKFYDDVAKGKYKGRLKEQLKIEQAIDNYRRSLANR